MIKMVDVILGSPPLELEVGGRDCIDSDIGEDACEGGAQLDDGVIAKASVGYDDGVDEMFCSTTALSTPPTVFAHAAMVVRTRWDINKMVLKALGNL